MGCVLLYCEWQGLEPCEGNRRKTKQSCELFCRRVVRRRVPRAVRSGRQAGQATPAVPFIIKLAHVELV